MKKKLLFFGIIAFFSFGTAMAQPVFQNSDLTISVLPSENKVWVVETSDKTTMYIIEGNDKAMLIDTGTRCNKLDEVIGQITKKPLFIVLTHAHNDHAGNIRYFKDIYLHQGDTVLLDKSYKGNLHFVQDGQKFDLGGRIIEVSHMPGHTPGSIVLLDKKAGVCYSGDAFGSGQVWLQVPPVMPVKIYISSLKKMEKLMDEGIQRIYCGHYPYVKTYFKKDYIVAMLDLAEELENGTAPEAKSYPTKLSVGTQNPMIVTKGQASVVYDPDKLK
jgi:glyoxylase-like metal-dependent hydrolase (beta-lactamase superfamily II)